VVGPGVRHRGQEVALSGVYHRILVALDGSPDADRALDEAIALAADQRARLTLLTVIPPPSGLAAMAPPLPESPDEAFARLLREATERVPQDVSVTSQARHGNPAHEIVAAAQEVDADLIVIGSRGHGRVADALLGSVSRAVVHGSHVPVLVTRASEPPAQTG
jgi:nucleotide-binding universal stress UspA family protein